MAVWLEEFLQTYARFHLIGASVFLLTLVFVFLIIGVWSKRRQWRRQRARGHEPGAGDDGSDMMALEMAAQTEISALPEAGLSETVIAPPSPPEKLSPEDLYDEAKLLENISQLEQQGNSVNLAKHYLGRADLALSARDTPVAQEYYLKGLSMAGLVNAPVQQAYARMALGDISHADGDLTSACEHWQLARDLWTKCGEKDRVAEIEERMNNNQCPTDWVLNEF